MSRGGKRPGSGPKKGTKYRRRFQLVGELAAQENGITPAQRMAALRHKIAVWTAGGMTPFEIAVIVGMGVAKLKAVFPRELEHGHAIARADLLARLDDAGSVAADKRLLDEIVSTAQKPAVTPNLGKKEAARIAARTEFTGTVWDDLTEKSEQQLPTGGKPN